MQALEAEDQLLTNDLLALIAERCSEELDDLFLSQLPSSSPLRYYANPENTAKLEKMSAAQKAKQMLFGADTKAELFADRELMLARRADMVGAAEEADHAFKHRAQQLQFNMDQAPLIALRKAIGGGARFGPAASASSPRSDGDDGVGAPDFDRGMSRSDSSDWDRVRRAGQGRSESKVLDPLSGARTHATAALHEHNHQATLHLVLDGSPHGMQSDVKDQLPNIHLPSSSAAVAELKSPPGLTREASAFNSTRHVARKGSTIHAGSLPVLPSKADKANAQGGAPAASGYAAVFKHPVKTSTLPKPRHHHLRRQSTATSLGDDAEANELEVGLLK